MVIMKYLRAFIELLLTIYTEEIQIGLKKLINILASGQIFTL